VRAPLVSVAAVQLRRIEKDAIGDVGVLDSDGDRATLAKGDLLVVEGNGSLEHIGRVALWGDDAPGARHQNHIIRVRPHRVSSRFLLEWLASPAGRNAIIEEATSGAGLYTLSLSKVARLPVPIPPPTEQARIVAKLTTIQTHSRRAREALDAVPPLLDKLRQSILAAAFRGDLTKDWRAKHPDVEPARKVVERTVAPAGRSSGRAATTSVRQGIAAISVGDPGTTTPKRWTWVPLSRIARMESGHTPSREHREYWDGDIPWIGIRDARASHGSVIGSTEQTVTSLGLENSAARLLPARTVCFSRTASVGYVTIMGRPMATSQDFANWICSDAILPEYLMFALLAEGDHIRKFGEGSTHTTIYFPELKALHICLAPIPEQREIVIRVQRALSRVMRFQSDADSRLASLAALERATLGRAFRGDLLTGPRSNNAIAE
jgi:type I restriction enzyme S subunit